MRVSLLPGVVKDPVQKARADWQVQAARPWPLERFEQLERLFGLHATRWPARPLRRPGAQAYGKAYNTELQALVKTHGPPAWAPGLVLPSRQALRRAMREALPLTTLAQLDALELGALLAPLHQSVLEHPTASADALPLAVARRSEPEGWLLLGSQLSRRWARIDVVDVATGEWLLSERYDRLWNGAAPWSARVADVKDALLARLADWRARHAETLAHHEARAAEAQAHAHARQQAALLAREARQAALRQRLEQEPACPHCHARSRHFRPLSDGHSVVCPGCHRSCAATALAEGPPG